MSDSPSLFGEEFPTNPATLTMTEQQRGRLRELFSALNLKTAMEQFDLVEVMTGRRIRSPLDLDASEAQALLVQLRHRVAHSRSPHGGTAWDDR